MTRRITDMRVHPGDSAYLIEWEDTAILYDSGFGFTGRRLAEKLRRHLGSRTLDYIFLSHSHYDHVLGSAEVLKIYPDAQVVAGEYTAAVFRREGALRKMEELDRKFAARIGIADYEFPGGGLRVDRTVREGDIVRTGAHSWRVLELPGHTKCSVGFYCPEEKLLLSSETLGVYDGRDRIVPAFLVGVKSALRSIDKVLALEPETLLLPHYGVLTREQTDYYLANIRSSAAEAAEFFASRLCAGMPRERIIEEFKQEYRKQYIAEAYPEDAVNLNTSIMIDLIEREFLK